MNHPRTLNVHETFISIQGEGIHSGRPMHFLRLSGCNHKCVYCDTPDHVMGPTFSTEEVFEKLSSPSGLPVYVTGGEPLLQEETLHLIVMLIASGREVHLDTNGSIDLGPVAPKAHKVVDIKTPGSGAIGSFLESNLEYINANDEIKFIITSQLDFNWGLEVTHKWELLKITPYIVFQPAYGMVDPKDLAEWVKDCGLPVRMGLQMHKTIWGPDAKGV